MFSFYFCCYYMKNNREAFKAFLPEAYHHTSISFNILTTLILRREDAF